MITMYIVTISTLQYFKYIYPGQSHYIVTNINGDIKLTRPYGTTALTSFSDAKRFKFRKINSAGNYVSSTSEVQQHDVLYLYGLISESFLPNFYGQLIIKTHYFSQNGEEFIFIKSDSTGTIIPTTTSPIKYRKEFYLKLKENNDCDNPSYLNAHSSCKAQLVFWKNYEANTLQTASVGTVQPKKYLLILYLE